MAHYGAMGAGLSGLLFSIAWWLFIDGAARANSDGESVEFIDALPMTGVTIFFIMLLSFDWKRLDGEDFEYEGGCANIQSWSRVCLFFTILIGFGACIGSGILMTSRWIDGDRIQFGIKNLLACIICFISLSDSFFIVLYPCTRTSL